MHPQMMAVEINEETWQIAAACLAGGFITIPSEGVLGCMLVINAPSASQIFHRRRPIRARYDQFDGDEVHEAGPAVTLGNCWLDRELFDKRYKFVDKETKNKFSPITMV